MCQVWGRGCDNPIDRVTFRASNPVHRKHMFQVGAHVSSGSARLRPVHVLLVLEQGVALAVALALASVHRAAVWRESLPLSAQPGPHHGTRQGGCVRKSRERSGSASQVGVHHKWEHMPADQQFAAVEEVAVG